MAIRPSTATAYTADNGAYYDASKYVPELYSKKVLRKN